MKQKSSSWGSLIEALEEAIPIYEEGSSVASLWTLQKFREKAVNLLAEKAGEVEVLLDEGMGPGGMANIIIAKIKPKIVLGLDASVKMLKQASQRLKDLNVKFYPVRGIFEYLPLKPQSIDLAVFSFSLRDALNIEQALSEVRKTLKLNGLTLILDIGKPRSRLLKAIYGFYLRSIMPLIVRVKMRVKGRNPWKEIYPTYLRFPTNTQLKQIIHRNFKTLLIFKEYCLGCVVIALASKPREDRIWLVG